MDTTPPTRAPRTHPDHEPRTAHDAFWWVVLYQGALDYTRSVGATGQDAEAATRLVDSYQAVRRP